MSGSWVAGLPPMTPRHVYRLVRRLAAHAPFRIGSVWKRAEQVARQLDESPHWKPGPFAREDLARALLDGRVAGPETSHDRANVRWKIRRLVEGDPDGQFGLSGVDRFGPHEVLAMVAKETGFDPDPVLDGPSAIDPYLVLDSCEAAGRRLARAGKRGEQVLLATGHPGGLALFYMAVGRLLEEAGAKLVRPLRGSRWKEGGRSRIQYLDGVAVLAEGGRTRHTHSPGPMQRMLREERPDLVFADHGFAGAAIQAGVDTLSIADVNDPGLVVAKHLGKTDVVIVMDDNVSPHAYWPCFHAIAAQFPAD